KGAGFLTYGCDLGSKYLEYGRERGLLLEHGEIDSLSKYGPAQLIFLNHVLEHFKFPVKSIEGLSNLLVDDGYLYIELPGIFNMHNTYGDFLLFLQNAHLYHFTLDTLTCVMSRAGFRLVKGDQTIRALYQKKNNMSQRTVDREFFRILRYLSFFELFKKFNLLNLFPKFCRIIFKI
ncbi:methyltransferase domain-containing protein, partial [Candidatus Pacearchaeota archaeon]|nr:methyltransferase domain-containing protein [Candidatus Pacearchaeota archaeon]